MRVSSGCFALVYFSIMTVLLLVVSISDKVAQLLLDAGADPNMKSIDGSTPVLKAIVARDIKTLKVLVTHPKTDLNNEVLCENLIKNYSHNA